MEEKNLIKKQILLFIISAISVSLLVLIWQLLAPFQMENDNFYLKTIVSGEMTGTPEAHMYYMSYLSGFIISTFYTITGNGIPWFGLAIVASLSVPMFLILYKTLCIPKKIVFKIQVFIVVLVFYISFFYHFFAKNHYTIATGFIGAGALFAYALSDLKAEKKYYIFQCIVFVLLSALSIGMRENAYLMLLPFFAAVFVSKLWDSLKENVKEEKKKYAKKLFFSSLILGVALIFVMLLNRAAYSSKEWKEYKAFNDARTQVTDFLGYPDYDSNRELYEENGITKSSYDAMTLHYNIILDSNINTDSYTALGEEAKKESLANSPSFFKKTINTIKKIITLNLFEYQDRPLNIPVYVLYLFVFILALIHKNKKAIRDLLFLFGARTIDWFYLVWNQRSPFRVTQIIYIAELVMLIANIINYGLWERFKKDDTNKNQTAINPVFAGLIVLLLIADFRFGIPSMKQYYESIKNFEKMSVCFEELEDYLNDHSDNFYFFDMSHLYYMEDTLSFKKSEYENYVYMGSWMPGSPWYNNKLKAWGINDASDALVNKDNVYIIYQPVDYDTRDFLDNYFEDHIPGYELQVVETFTSSNGFVYEILKATPR